MLFIIKGKLYGPKTYFQPKFPCHVIEQKFTDLVYLVVVLLSNNVYRMYV